MRKVVVFNVVSLDGYHTGPANDVSVMFPMMGGVFDAYTAELLRAADTTLVGRVSFELFNGFWPEVARDPDSPRWTDEQRALAKAGAAVPTLVVSDTLTGELPNVRIVRRADAHRRIAQRPRPLRGPPRRRERPGGGRRGPAPSTGPQRHGPITRQPRQRPE